MWRRLALSAVLSLPMLGNCLLRSSGDHSVQKDDAKPTLSEVVLLEAWYGDPASKGADVTDIVRASLSRSNSMRVDPSVFTDTAENHHKVLWIKYKLRGRDRAFCVPDEKTLSFSSLLEDAPKPGSYQLVSANYQGTDVSKQVKSMLAEGVCAIPVSFSAFEIADPSFGSNKTLSLTFKLADGTVRAFSGTEGQMIPLRSLLPLREVPEVTNGSFGSTDITAIGGEQIYVPAADNALSQPGTFTICKGILRPFQLEHSIRADFVEHTNRADSMAMWIYPVLGRQPVLLWEQNVEVQPNADYEFSCSTADISDSDSLFATIVLEVGNTRTKPFVIQDVFKWHNLRLPIHTGNGKTVHLKVWRDVLPYDSEGPAALGLDDIEFVATRKDQS